MHTLFIITIMLLTLASCVSPDITTSKSNQAEITETLKRLEYEAISAEFRLDTAAISRVIHENFIAVYPNKLQNKQQELAGIYKNIVRRKQEGETMDSLYLDHFRADVYGNTAIVTFHTVTKGRRNDGPYEDQRWRWYDVWVKERGEWKLVSSQGTPLTKP